MKFKASSAFAICGAAFVPDADGLVDVPDDVRASEEFKHFVEANARSIAPAKSDKPTAAPKAE